MELVGDVVKAHAVGVTEDDIAGAVAQRLAHRVRVLVEHLAGFSRRGLVGIPVVLEIVEPSQKLTLGVGWQRQAQLGDGDLSKR